MSLLLFALGFLFGAEAAAFLTMPNPMAWLLLVIAGLFVIGARVRYGVTR